MRGIEPYKGRWFSHTTECHRINIISFQSMARIGPLKEGGEAKS